MLHDEKLINKCNVIITNLSAESICWLCLRYLEGGVALEEKKMAKGFGNLVDKRQGGHWR